MSEVTQLQTAINDNYEALAAVQGDLASCEEKIRKVSNLSTEIKFLLKDHDTIKIQHNLAGTPYLEMTTQEEECLESLENVFSSEKEAMLESLKLKKQELAGQANTYATVIGNLTNSLYAAQAEEQARKEAKP